MLLTAVVVAVVALGVLARRTLREPASSPTRLVAQLHLSQWAALFLAIQGAINIGLAVGGQFQPGAALELGAGLLWISLAGATLRAPLPQGLHLLAVALGLHGALAFAHRPGWIASDLAPDWFWLGQAILDLYVATLCSLCARSRT